MIITDHTDRQFKNLRISLTDVCNLACVYCVSDDQTHLKVTQSPVEKIIEKVAALDRILDLQSVRLTGGEPLLYKALPELIEGLKQIGIPYIKMTSNAALLEKQAVALYNAGLSEINISLDAVDPTVFYNVTRRKNLDQVLKGILKSRDAGIHVKLNAVIIRNKNHDQVVPLAKFAEKEQLIIRYLEFMNMGPLYKEKSTMLYSQTEILNDLAKEYSFVAEERKTNATANYWQTNTGFRFGIIANESSPFCADCNRLRLDSKGNIYGCLSSNIPVQLDDNSINDKEQLKAKLLLALSHKQQHRFAGSELSMKHIGG